MRVSATGFQLSATDLSVFLSCRHRTALELAEANGKHRRPYFDDPLLDALFKRGLEHERSYLQLLERTHRNIRDLTAVKDFQSALNETRDAMQRGVDVIAQGALIDEIWYGRPDVMLRVERVSELG